MEFLNIAAAEFETQYSKVNVHSETGLDDFRSMAFHGKLD